MKLNVKFIILPLAVLAIIIVAVIIANIKLKIKKNDENMLNSITESVEQNYENIKENSVMYEEGSTIDLLKEEYKITGDGNLYEIQTEYDGRKVLVIKPEINYKVAFAGMINKNMPTFSEVDKIFEEKYPKKSGIWIEETSREKITKLFNNSDKTNSKYVINNEGYLKIEDSNKLTNTDRKIKELIEEEKQYILSMSSSYFMVDNVTGEIVENRYNDLSEYQTYEYVETENKMVIFLSENKENKLIDSELFNSLIELLTY